MSEAPHLDDAPAWTEEDAANVVPFRAPRTTAKADARPDLATITLEAGELHNIATAAERALIDAETPFYVRGERLVRPVVDDLPASHGQRTKVARLADVTEAAMIDRLSRSATWIKFDGRAKAYVTTDPPAKIAATVLARDGEWLFPRLSGVITTPTLRPDGTILRDAGYDAATQLLLLDPPEMPPLPARPSKAAGAKALARLDSLLDEFPFIDAASRSVALSALITPVVRGALPVAPMHVTKAPVAGSGKSYIIDVASALNSGERAPVITAGRTEEETEKRLVAALLSGQTIITLDNVNGELGGDALCQIIERPVVSVRPLGRSDTIKVESRASCYATGNNIRLVGDLTRRVLLCSLDPDMERPELRAFKASPYDEVIKRRGFYVAAALTVVRSYVVAGCPDPCPPLASFEDWSRLVRSALVWLGRPDPVATMEQARADDPARAALIALYTAWRDTIGDMAVTSAELMQRATETDPHGHTVNPDLLEALKDVGTDRKGALSTLSIGRFVAAHEGRVAQGLKLEKAGKAHNSKVLWKVVSK